MHILSLNNDNVLNGLKSSYIYILCIYSVHDEDFDEVVYPESQGYANFLVLLSLSCQLVLDSRTHSC